VIGNGIGEGMVIPASRPIVFVETAETTFISDSHAHIIIPFITKRTNVLPLVVTLRPLYSW
jgi:hypothetical protein